MTAPHPAHATLADGLDKQVPARDKRPRPTLHGRIVAGKDNKFAIVSLYMPALAAFGEHLYSLADPVLPALRIFLPRRLSGSAQGPSGTARDQLTRRRQDGMIAV